MSIAQSEVQHETQHAPSIRTGRGHDPSRVPVLPPRPDLPPGTEIPEYLTRQASEAEADAYVLTVGDLIREGGTDGLGRPRPQARNRWSGSWRPRWPWSPTPLCAVAGATQAAMARGIVARPEVEISPLFGTFE